MKKLKAAYLDDYLPMHQKMDDIACTSSLLEISKSFTNPKDFLNALPNLDCDLCLIDIYMPEINGIEVARNLKNKPFIFVTGVDSSYLLKEALALSPIDILIKPLTKERFNKAAEKAYHYIAGIENKKNRTLFNINNNRGKTVIDLENILLVETDVTDSRDKLLYMKSGEVLKAKRCNLNELLSSTNNLVRVNKGAALALSAVHSVEHNSIILNFIVDNLPKQVSLGYTFAKEFKRRFSLRFKIAC